MPRRPFDSLLARLLAGSLIAFGVAAGVFALAQIALTGRFADLLLRDSLTEQAIDVCEGLYRDPVGGALRVALPSALRYGYDTYVDNFQYRVLDATGAAVLASPKGEAILAPAGRSDATFFRYEFDGRPMHAAAVECPLDGRRYTVQAGRSDRFSELASDAIAPAVLETGLAMGAVSIAVFALMAVWTTRRALRPVRAAAQAAQAITPRTLRARLPEAGLPSEVRPLVGAFNQALERVEAGYNLQQQFLAAAAHELKTPLALLRSQIELDGTALPVDRRTQLLADVDDMARVVRQMLHLAEVSETQNYRFAQTELAGVVDEAIAFLARLATGRGATVVFEVAPAARGTMHRADRGAMFVLVKNLLENAILHSPPGGRVSIMLDVDGLRVLDQGAGIEPADLPRVFDRFWRTNDSRQRGGAGLGLAICSEIALRHGWSLAAANQPGAGAIFTLAFGPRA
jgi:two-component system sensor histidine kinase QseC